MSELYETITALCQARGISGGKLCTDLGLSRSKLTDLKMGRIKTLSAGNLSKIAEYLEVSVDYLLGKEREPDTSLPEKGRRVTDEDIKFALFQGYENITDDMYAEVKAFAEFIKNKYEKEKK